MGFADAGKLGVPIRPRVYSDKLPKNVAQEGVEGAVFEIGGINPETFNIEHDLHAKIVKSEYFKCLYVFKTFDKVVDLVYEKGPTSSPGRTAARRSGASSSAPRPRSASCSSSSTCG